MKVKQILHDRGGLARTADFRRAGVDRSAIDRALCDGTMDRVRRGVYAKAGLARDSLVAARHGGELACVSALRTLGVWVLDDELDSTDADSPIHVWVGPSGRQHKHEGCGCKVHYEEWTRTPGLGTADAALALIQYAGCAPEERFFASLESALRQGLVTDAGRGMIRRRIRKEKRWIVDLARTDADSGLESLLRFRLHLLGISLESQVSIPGITPVDFVLGGRIILEADGRENHDGPSKRHKDLMRDAVTAALGYETLRFDYAMIVYRWQIVLDAILGRMRRIGLSLPQEEAYRL